MTLHKGIVLFLSSKINKSISHDNNRGSKVKAASIDLKDSSQMS